MGIVRYDESVKRDIVRYAFEGLCNMEIADCVGVNYTTLSRWFNKFPKLAEAVRGARLHGGRKVVEYGLFKLARGSEEVTEEASWMEVTSEGKPRKVTRTIKKQRPDLKAIQTLAKKYASEYTEAIEDGNTLNINVNQLSLRELMTMRDNTYDAQHERLGVEESENDENDEGTPPFEKNS